MLIEYSFEIVLMFWRVADECTYGIVFYVYRRGKTHREWSWVFSTRRLFWWLSRSLPTWVLVAKGRRFFAATNLLIFYSSCWRLSLWVIWGKWWHKMANILRWSEFFCFHVTPTLYSSQFLCKNKQNIKTQVDCVIKNCILCCMWCEQQIYFMFYDSNTRWCDAINITSHSIWFGNFPYFFRFACGKNCVRVYEFSSLPLQLQWRRIWWKIWLLILAALHWHVANSSLSVRVWSEISHLQTWNLHNPQLTCVYQKYLHKNTTNCADGTLNVPYRFSSHFWAQI